MDTANGYFNVIAEKLWLGLLPQSKVVRKRIAILKDVYFLLLVRNLED